MKALCHICGTADNRRCPCCGLAVCDSCLKRISAELGVCIKCYASLISMRCSSMLMEERHEANLRKLGFELEKGELVDKGVYIYKVSFVPKQIFREFFYNIKKLPVNISGELCFWQGD